MQIHVSPSVFCTSQCALADLEGGGVLRGFKPPPPFKEINKTKQIIGDNPLEKEERESCMFV